MQEFRSLFAFQEQHSSGVLQIGESNRHSTRDQVRALQTCAVNLFPLILFSVFLPGWGLFGILLILILRCLTTANNCVFSHLYRLKGLLREKLILVYVVTIVCRFMAKKQQRVRMSNRLLQIRTHPTPCPTISTALASLFPKSKKFTTWIWKPWPTANCWTPRLDRWTTKTCFSWVQSPGRMVCTRTPSDG